MKSNLKKTLFIYLFFLVLLLIISLLAQIDLDGIWEYGFSYNISEGLIPYKDFNMVVGPFYNLLFSIPMILFGNNFYVFELMHCIIYALVFTFIYNRIGKKSIYVLLLLGLLFTLCGYNSFCVVLVLLILALLDSDIKYKDYMIGIVIGIIFMTKHNIGICFSILYLILSKHKLKSLLSILIPVIPILIYLYLNNALIGYIEFCYLGLGSFVENLYADILSLIIFTIALVILIKELIKYKNSDRKDKKILYVATFFIFAFPILDQGHAVPILIPLSYYLLSKEDINKKLVFFTKYFIIIGYIATTIGMCFKAEFNLKNNYLKYQMIPNGFNYYLENYNKYLDDNIPNGNKLYLLVENSYAIRLYRNEKIGMFDLINDGNLGGKDSKYIELMADDCKENKCVFILDSRFFKNKRYFQYSKEFKDYVVDNYKYYETMPSKDRIYKNY